MFKRKWLTPLLATLAVLAAACSGGGGSSKTLPDASPVLHSEFCAWVNPSTAPSWCAPAPTTTTTTTTPPAPKNTFAAVETKAGQVTVTWTGYAPTKLGRDGTDSTGYGAWDTSQFSPPGIPAANLAAKSFTFTSLKPATTYTFTLTAGTTVVTAKVTTAGVAPPPPTTTTLKMGAFAYDLNGALSYGTLIGHRVDVVSSYWDTRDLSYDNGFIDATAPWLAQDPNRQVLLGINPLVGEPGNWYSTSLDAQMAGLRDKLASTGHASQYIIRFAYEMNGDWMPWGPRCTCTGSGFGNTQGFKDMWRREHAIMASTGINFTWDYSTVPWAGNTQELEATWPGNDVVNDVGMDIYPAYGGQWSDFSVRYDVGVAFANSHGMTKSIDEQALWATPTGTGDDLTFITNSLGRDVSDGFSWRIYFNVTDGGVNCTITCYPNGLAAERAFWSGRILAGVANPLSPRLRGTDFTPIH